MGLLTRSLGIQALSVEDPAQPLLPPGALYETLGLGRSDAGVLVNEHQAMRISTAQACIRIISEDLASVSHEILQHLPDGTVRQAIEHRLWPLLHDQPNEYMTAMTFWGALVACALGWGSGYSLIKRDRAARVTDLIPLHSAKTSPVRTREGQLLYATTQTDTGGVAYIDPQNILHIPGLTFDGLNALGPIQTCKNTFGLTYAAEKFGAQFFGNGARASGVLSHPETLGEEAYKNLVQSLRERMNGDNALSPLILEEGMEWTQMTVSPNEAQFLLTRQFQRSEIAQLFRVPLHLLQDLQRATNNNIEHQSLDYVRYGLRPWAVRIEQEVNRKLLGGPYKMEHNLADLQRGDFASQTQGYQALRNIGVYSTNDVLRKLRENPISAEEGGDVRTVQGAMVPLTALLPPSDDTQQDPSDAPGGSDSLFDRIAPTYRHMFRDAVGRVVNRGGTGEFVRFAFHPLVSSMMQAMLAVRFGECEIRDGDLAAINRQVASIVEAAPAWTRPEASAIASRLTDQTYQALSKHYIA